MGSSIASIRLGTTLRKLCCYTNSSSSPCYIFYHDAFPHHFQWFHPNSRCLQYCLTFFFSRTGPLCKAISRCYFIPLPVVLSQLLRLFCSIRLLPKTALVAAFCAAPSGSVWACIPQRSVASIHPDRLWPAWMPSWCRMALLLCKCWGLSALTCFLPSISHSWLNVQMLFPLRDHDRWKIWHGPLVRTLCVCRWNRI